jgi:hypothetical protein
MTTKTCTKCQQAFPVEAFRPYRRRGYVGRHSWCPTCERTEQLARRRQPEVRARARSRWISKADRTRTCRKCERELSISAFDPHRWVCRVCRHKHDSKRRDPAKQRARVVLKEAVRWGKIVKPKHCQECGQAVPPARLQGHHHDYSKPLEARWLCATCHGRAHRIWPDENAVQGGQHAVA